MLSLACHRGTHSTCELWPLCSCACHPENKGIDDLDREALHKLYVKYAQSKYYQTWCQKNIERYGAARSDRHTGAVRSDRRPKQKQKA